MGAMRVLIIGGGSGIGAAVAAAHRERGDATVVWDIAGECDVTCDVAVPSEIEAAVASLDTGALPDQVTITVGVGHFGLLTDVTVEDWDRIMAINTRGPWLCLRALARVMQAAGRPCSMVATSSVSAHLVDRTMGVYCASKAALSMVVKVAAAEWGAEGIRVNAIAPGVTDTPMLGAPLESPWLQAIAGRTTLGRIGQADDIAQAVLALHEMHWVTGQVLDCDGGLGMYSPINALAEIARMQKDRAR